MFNIMVVEDNVNVQKLMEAVLIENGYRPILAKDGLEALEILDKQHIDLIVLDIMMPNMDGYELTKVLRESKKIFTRRQLMDEIWGLDSDSDERTVDVHINRLRERFRDNEDFKIVTIRGLGYKTVSSN